MSQPFQPLLAVMEQEADATRRTLERVPGDRLAWRPHEKSMSLGQLARHVATIPGDIAQIVAADFLDVSEIEPTSQVDSADELLPLLERSLETAKQVLAGMDDERATGGWRLTAGDETLMEIPRVACFTVFGINHWCHHRAQLGVYLRLLDVPVPATYGPSADENPFADVMAATESN